MICIHELADLSAKRGFTPVMEKLFSDASTLSNTRKNMMKTSDQNLFKHVDPKPISKQPSDPDLKKEGKAKKKAAFVGFIDEPVFESPKRQESKEEAKEALKPEEPKTEPAEPKREEETHSLKPEEPRKEEPKHEEKQVHEKVVEETQEEIVKEKSREEHEPEETGPQESLSASTTIDEPVFDVPKREDEEEPKVEEEEPKGEEAPREEEPKGEVSLDEERMKREVRQLNK